MNMDVFVARQPIFKQNMQLYGYELLYRNSRQNNFFEGTDDTRSTAELISNSFLVIGFNELIEDTRGFINFSAELLLNKVPMILPREKVVIEVLERVVITEEVLRALESYKAMGYVLALDDFVLEMDDPNAVRLLELADIVKIVFPEVPQEKQRRLIRTYRHKITFLAEHIETRGEFQIAAKMGYTLFQGYFFSKPSIINAAEIQAIQSNVTIALQELSQPEPNLGRLSEIFEQDVGLSYKLMRLVNSAYYSPAKQLKSIRHAIMYIGTKELYVWLHLIFLKSMQTAENRELIKLSVIRAKTLSLLAQKTCADADCFFVGIFSSLDIILNQDMEQALSGLPLSQTVKNTLLNIETPLTPYLHIALALETGYLDGCAPLLKQLDLTLEQCMGFYLEALKWQQSLAI